MHGFVLRACFSELQTNAKGFRDPTDFRIFAHLVEEQNAEFWGVGFNFSIVLGYNNQQQGGLICLHDVLGGIIGGFHVPGSNQRGRMKMNI